MANYLAKTIQKKFEWLQVRERIPVLVRRGGRLDQMLQNLTQPNCTVPVQRPNLAATAINILKFMLYPYDLPTLLQQKAQFEFYTDPANVPTWQNFQNLRSSLIKLGAMWFQIIKFRIKCWNG